MRLQDAPGVVMLLVMIGLILGAGLLALDAFDDTLTAGSDAAVAVGNTSEGIANLSEQLPTVGTIIGVALIIVVVVAAFAFGGRYK